MNRYLLVIATRGYADCGKIPEDEYCSQWGLPNDKDGFRWFWSDHIDLLVLHGCKQFNLEELIVKAAKSQKKQRTDNVKSGWFFHHSIQPNNMDGINRCEEQVTETLKQRVQYVLGKIKEHLHPSMNECSYQSRGGLAVEELLNGIRRLKPDGYEHFVEAIEKVVSGRMLFVAKLRAIQTGLIRLQFLLEIVDNTPCNIPAYEDALEQIGDVGKELRMNSEESKGKFGQWLRLIDKRGIDDEKKSTDLLAFLNRGSNAELVQAKWEGLEYPKQFLIDRGKNKNGVKADIVTFTIAIDVLLEVAEVLPQTLPMSEKDMEQ